MVQEKYQHFLLPFALFLFLALSGCTAIDGSIPLGDILGSSGGALDENTVAAGLKEALRVGTERTVRTTGGEDGFFGNALIRIMMPDEFKTAASALRAVGFGSHVDEFELGMNRAAERASSEATSVFWGAITKMTLADAFNILHGSETAACDYFREQTAETLRSRFHPIVTEKMEEVGLYTVYNSMMAKYTALPMVSEPVLDLDGYITDKALDGLFSVLAMEEKRIREDPVARSTDLLRRVFAAQDK